MKVKWGAFITEGRGKVGGTVFSKNRWGPFSRNLVTPTNVINDYTSGVRNAFNDTVQAWRDLSDDDKDQWNTFAIAHPRTDVFGDPYTLTGQTMMLSMNQNRYSIGETPLSTPGAGSAPVQDLSFTFNTIDTSDITIDWNDPPAAGSAFKVPVFATAPLSTGRTTVTTQLRQIMVFEPDSSGTLSVFDQYVAKFGAPIVGQRIFIRVGQIDIDTGLPGVSFINNAIVQ